MKNSQLKKGIVQTLILDCLEEQERYGYEILQLLDKKSLGVFKMKEGTLYPVLYRLEDSKFIESYWINDNEKRGKPKKYYKITLEGKASLKNGIEEWKIFKQIVNQILKID
ncbi:PadR family transcriptional regulator [Herbivorax sp. ANBcel31]|uniref:PadR family transcriptional regulator n=1 Tax=Herbivorax sp. ANBcel31 TaxID=3069754 RepID=UPI0027B802BE|nr:PadR family transcriptional regulator [Herbivorax sp. ANBcel31]MDQ2086467.1 PadR family transcriptional regulator [Herbivorax sp. ANBcel31]